MTRPSGPRWPTCPTSRRCAGDFLDEYTQKPDGTYEFIYGPLIRAMLEGRVLFITDAILISPAVLAICYPAMDGRREVIVKARRLGSPER